MATDPNEEINTQPAPDRNSGESIWDRSITISIEDCVNGFPEGYGPESAHIPETTVNYQLVVVFEDLEKLREYQSRPEAERREIENTMAKFMREAGNTPLNWEILGDDNPNRLNEQTIQQLNGYVAPELVRIMNASYPGIGISQAGVWPEVEEIPGCAYPKDKVDLDALHDRSYEQGGAQFSSNAVFKF